MFTRKQSRAGIRRWTAALAVFLAAGILSAVPAAAQGGNDASQECRQAEDLILQTQQAMDRARDVIRQSDSERAMQLFLGAETKLTNAGQARQARRCVIAIRLAREAQEQTRLALGTAQEAQAQARRSEEAIQHAQRFMERAWVVVSDSDVREAQTLMGQAREQLGQAQSAHTERHYETAYRLATSSERMAQQAVRLIDAGGPGGPGGSEGSGGPGGAEGRVERELRRTDRFLERAREVVADSGDERAAALLGRAAEVQERALAFWEQGRAEGALHQTRQAQRMIRQALAGLQGENGAEGAERAVVQVAALIERMEPRILESGNADAIQTLELAVRHLERAQDELADDNPRGALAEAKVARDLVRRAVQLAEVSEDGLE
jgi:tetratricopeptide (TPR) repeat protein